MKNVKKIKAYAKTKGKREEEPAEEGKHHSMTIWICPECGTRFTGWSTLKACSKCGYTEE